MPFPTPSGTDANGRRKVVRSPVAFEGHVRLADLSKVKVRVVEISTNGFRVMTPAKLRTGDAIYLHIPSLSPLHALVRWNALGVYGCEFIQPLYPAVADHIAHKYPDHYLQHP